MDEKEINSKEVQRKQFILNHNNWVVILSLSWPIALGMLLQAGFNIADMKFVSMIGKVEMAAVGAVNVTFFFVLSIIQMIGIGTISLISRFFGLKRYDAVGNVLKSSIYLITVISLSISIVTFIFARNIVGILGANSPALIQFGTDYIQMLAFGIAPNLIGWIISYGFQGIGDFKTPMIAMLAGTMANLILDPILIFGFGPIPSLGVTGAGLATALSQILVFAFLVAKLFNRKSLFAQKMKAEMSKHIKFTLNPIHWIKQIEFNIIGQITRIGFPIGIQFMTVFISLTLLQNMVSALGSSNLAAVTIVIRFIFILGLPVIAFTDAVTSIVGISLGAEKIKRAVRTSNYAIILSLLFTMFITSLTTLFNHEIIMFFAEFENSTDIEEVLRLGIIALKYIIVIIFCWIPVFVYGGAFKGAGDTIPPLISGIIRSALIFLFFMANHPSMQVLPKFVLKSNPFENILLITTIAFGIEGIIIFIWFHRKKWIEKSFLNMQRVSSQ